MLIRLLLAIVGSVLTPCPVDRSCCYRMIHKDIVLKGVLGQLLLQVFGNQEVRKGTYSQYRNSRRSIKRKVGKGPQSDNDYASKGIPCHHS